MTDLAQNIAANLLRKEAVRVSINPPFTWTSGIKSPIYCDNRKMIAFPEERRAVVEGFKNLIAEKGLKFDVIGGTATAAIPWAAFLAYELDMPMIYIRAEKKEHGAGKQIEGYLEAGKRVLIVEDLISTGGSSCSAAQAVRDEGGCVVEDIVAIVTYGMGAAAENFAKADLNIHTLTDFSHIVEKAAEMGAISAGDMEMVKAFAQDPAGWGGKMGL